MDRLSLITIGNNIFLFHTMVMSHKLGSFHIYDVLNDQWNEKEVDSFKVKYVISCSKLPVS